MATAHFVRWTKPSSPHVKMRLRNLAKLSSRLKMWHRKGRSGTLGQAKTL